MRKHFRFLLLLAFIAHRVFSPSLCLPPLSYVDISEYAVKDPFACANSTLFSYYSPSLWLLWFSILSASEANVKAHLTAFTTDALLLQNLPNFHSALYTLDFTALHYSDKDIRRLHQLRRRMETTYSDISQIRSSLLFKLNLVSASPVVWLFGSLAEEKAIHSYAEDWVSFYNLANEKVCTAFYEGERECDNAKRVLGELSYAIGTGGSEYEAIAEREALAHQALVRYTSAVAFPNTNFTYFDDAVNAYLGPEGLKPFCASLAGTASRTLLQWQNRVSSAERDALNAEHLFAKTWEKAEEEKVGQINYSYAPFFTTFSSSPEVELAHAFALAQNASFHLAEARRILEEKPKGYLPKALEHFQKARIEYLSALALLNQTLAEAELATKLLEQRVKGKLSLLPNEIPEEIREEKRQQLALCRAMPSLGGRFLCFLSLLNEISALNNNASTFVYEKVQLENARAVLQSAKRDGLDVSSEQEELKQLVLLYNRGQLSTSQLQRALDSLKESVLAKAQMQYPSLLEERKKLLGTLELCGASCKDLREELYKAERGCIPKGTSLYITCLGRLAELSPLYAKLELLAERRMEQTLESHLTTQVETRIPWAAVDNATLAHVLISVDNPTPFSKKNARISFNLGIDATLLRSQLVVGQERVLTVINDGKKKTVVLDLLPHDHIVLDFAVPLRLAYTKAVKGRFFGSELTGVVENRDYTIAVEKDVMGLVFPPPCHVLNASFDGFSVALPQVPGPIKKGTHHLLLTCLAQSAKVRFVLEKSSTKQTAFTTFVSETYLLNTSVPLSFYTLSLPIPSEAEKIQVGSSFGNTLALRRIDGRLWIKIRNLRPGATRLYLSYEVNNLTAYVKQQAALFRNTTLTPKEKQFLEDVELYLNAGEPNKAFTALRKLQRSFETRRAQELVQERAKEEERAKIQRIRAELQRLANETSDQGIGRALAEIANISDSSLLEQNLHTFIRGKKKELKREISTLREWFLEHHPSPEVFALLDQAEEQLTLQDFMPNDPSALVKSAELVKKAKDEKTGVVTKLQRKRGILASQLSALVKRAEELAPRYLNQRLAAQGSKYEHYFPLDAKAITRMIDKAKGLLAQQASLEELNLSLSDLRKLNAGLNATLGNLTSLYQAKRARALVLAHSLQGKMRKKVLLDIEYADKLMAQGKPVEANLFLDKAMREWTSVKQHEHESTLVLILTLALFLAIGLYYLKERLRFDKMPKQKRKLKKLR